MVITVLKNRSRENSNNHVQQLQRTRRLAAKQAVRIWEGVFWEPPSEHAARSHPMWGGWFGRMKLVAVSAEGFG